MMIINRIWPGLIIIIAVAAFACYMLISTYYIISGNNLVIKCGFMENTIKIDSITKIKETNNPLSAPATSLDRVAIYYSKSGFIMISPKNKSEFINKLMEKNPCIEVKLKTKS